MISKLCGPTMSGSPGSSGSNPRKFSEKIALHNQKQAEETRAFDQLMTDLTVSRVSTAKFGNYIVPSISYIKCGCLSLSYALLNHSECKMPKHIELMRRDEDASG